MAELDSSRTKVLIGEDGVKKLQSKNITIVGVGGVGGYVATILVRAGVGNVTLVDFDKVSPSNINRQVVANVDTIGLSKVKVLRDMLLKINPNLNCTIFDEKVDSGSVGRIILPCDICIDCIDSVSDKVSLITHCKKHNIKIISAMGAGNRTTLPHFYMTDIYKTHDDGLAKVLRKKLRDEGVESLDVVTCDQKVIKHQEKVVGSISYYPAMCGITIAAIVINKLLEEE